MSEKKNLKFFGELRTMEFIRFIKRINWENYGKKFKELEKN